MSETPPFPGIVTDQADLRLLYGEPSDIARRKDIGVLDAHCRAFIAHSPFVLIATAGADGRSDVSPKGDALGSVMTRRPTVMTRHLGGHQAVWRGQERPFSLPRFSPSSTVLPHVKTGRLRALAITTAARLPSLPDLPTGAESGLGGYETLTWFGFVAPVKTPQAAVARLNAELVKVLAAPEVRGQFAGQGIETLGGTPEQFSAYIRVEIDKWARVIKLSGAKAE
jgi:hypothetical protein